MIALYAASDFNSRFARFDAGRPGAPKEISIATIVIKIRVDCLECF